MRYRVWMPCPAYREAASRSEPVPFPAGYDPVGFVDASGLEAAFHAGQNTRIPWNPACPLRSVSVGDVFTAGALAWRVADAGFAAIREVSRHLA